MYFITCFLKASFLSIQILPFSVEKVILFSNLLKSGEPGCLKKKKKKAYLKGTIATINA